MRYLELILVLGIYVFVAPLIAQLLPTHFIVLPIIFALGAISLYFVSGLILWKIIQLILSEFRKDL
ncbi:MAG: hypothetical protein ACYDHP_13350 [Ferrimicrobium sp.]